MKAKWSWSGDGKRDPIKAVEPVWRRSRIGVWASGAGEEMVRSKKASQWSWCGNGNVVLMREIEPVWRWKELFNGSCRAGVGKGLGS